VLREDQLIRMRGKDAAKAMVAPKRNPNESRRIR
jgi:hypothetical protein